MIATDRLLLRGWEARDRAPFAAMNADPAVMDFPRPLTRAESDAELDSFRRSLAGRTGSASRRSSGSATAPSSAWSGSPGAISTLPFCPCVEIGWRLPREHWGQGYATEAAAAWLDHGFGGAWPR